ncbi:MAG: hypothetical protein LBJ18_01500 [Rickettsiales bacterium]|nr:hypothetical protein [Rickettsiales bacterium]
MNRDSTKTARQTEILENLRKELSGKTKRVSPVAPAQPENFTDTIPAKIILPIGGIMNSDLFIEKITNDSAGNYIFALGEDSLNLDDYFSNGPIAFREMLSALPPLSIKKEPATLTDEYGTLILGEFDAKTNTVVQYVPTDMQIEKMRQSKEFQSLHQQVAEEHEIGHGRNLQFLFGDSLSIEQSFLLAYFDEVSRYLSDFLKYRADYIKHKDRARISQYPFDRYPEYFNFLLMKEWKDLPAVPDLEEFARVLGPIAMRIPFTKSYVLKFKEFVVKNTAGMSKDQLVGNEDLFYANLRKMFWYPIGKKQINFVDHYGRDIFEIFVKSLLQQEAIQEAIAEITKKQKQISGGKNLHNALFRAYASGGRKGFHDYMDNLVAVRTRTLQMQFAQSKNGMHK